MPLPSKPPTLVCPLLLVASMGACIDRNAAATDPVGYGEVRQVVDVGRPALDLLFVIDNSGSMKQEQDALAANFQRFVATLEGIEGGLPDLHIGVISTDVGTGRDDIDGCEGDGDNGRLQAAPRGTCSGPEGRFLRSVANPDGSRAANFDGSLAESFGCIAKLGTAGCGFEQPLESMRRALAPDNAYNAGFLRDKALLAVVFITDEDDCSASDRALFDADEPIGPFSDFRCFEQGVVCRDDDPRTPGAKQDCRPRADSAYLESIDDYADFLVERKGDPAKVFVAGIVGDSEPISVAIERGIAALQPSCSSEVGVADPAVRLAAFFERFAERHTVETICTADQSDALEQIADDIGTRIPRLCLPDTLTDLHPDRPGLQADCVVADVFPDGSESLLAACDEGVEPCFRVVTDDEQCAARIEIVPSQRNLPLGTRTEARCAVN